MNVITNAVYKTLIFVKNLPTPSETLLGVLHLYGGETIENANVQNGYATKGVLYVCALVGETYKWLPVSENEFSNTCTGLGSACLAGTENTVSGIASLTAGSQNTVTSDYAKAFGSLNNVSGYGATAIGTGLEVSTAHQFVFGHYNEEDSTCLEIVGNGTRSGDTANRSNARTLDVSGNEVLAGTCTATDFKVNGVSICTPQTITFTKADGVTTYNSQRCFVINGVVTMILNATIKEALENGYMVLGTISSEYAPARTVNVNVLSNQAKMCYVSVEANGEVRLTKSTESILANDGVRCTINFVVNY